MSEKIAREAELNRILEGSQVGVWEWCITTGQAHINKRWADMLGYTLEELTPLTYARFVSMVHPEDLPGLEAALQRHICGESEFFVSRFRMQTATASWRWIKARGQISALAADGSPEWMSGVHLDVSQLMELVEVQAQVNKRLDNILLASPAVIYAAEPAAPHTLRYLSPNAATLFGTPSAALIESGGWLQQIHGDDREKAVANFTNWLKTSHDEPLRQRYRVVRGNGEVIWLDDICRQVLDQGRVIELVGSVADVTEVMHKEELLKQVVDIVPGVIYQFKRSADGNYSFPYSSRKMMEIYGVTPQQVERDATAVFGTIHPEDLRMVQESIEQSATQLQPWRLDYRLLPSATKAERWLHGEALPVSHDDGSVQWSGMIMDITRQKQAEHELSDAKNRLERAQRIARIGHWEADMVTGALYWSDIIYEIFGFDPAHTTPSVELFSNCVHPEDLDAVRASERRAEVTGIHDVEHRIIRPDGAILWVHELAQRERSADGRDILYGTVRDITATKELELELRQLSTTDALTQVFNRRYFMQTGSQAIERARRSGKPASVIMLDLDHFKQINDTYGHAKGDEVLIRVAALLRSRVRQADTLARLGGEEFIVMLEACPLAFAVDIAGQIRDAVAELAFVSASGQRFSVTASIGVTEYQSGESLDSIMTRADGLLYAAKHAGRNRVTSELSESGQLSE